MESQLTNETYTKDMSEIKSTLKEHSEDIAEIKATLKEHSEDIKEIKAKLDQCVTKDVYEKEMSEVKSTLKEHSEDIAEIKATLKKHSEDIEELKEMMKSFQRTMLIVEDAVTNKIPALFDGYSMHQEKQEELEGKVEKLEQITQTHSIRIAALETVSSEDKKRLSKMSS